MTVTPDGLGRLPDVNKDGIPPWFVDIGEPEPLMSTAELQAAIARGEVPAGTLVWRLGMDSWVPYETLDEIQRTDAAGGGAHEPIVTPVVPGGRESDPPRDTRVEHSVPFDTDPAPPPSADSEPSHGRPTARARRSPSRERSRLQLDTIPEDYGHTVPDVSDAQQNREQQDAAAEKHGKDKQSAAARKRGSLWRQPQPSLPPRPSLSVSATATRASPEQRVSAGGTPIPKNTASAAKTESPEPRTATAPDDKPNLLLPPAPVARQLGPVSSAARKRKEEHVLVASPAPAGARAGMLSDAPTNPRQDALPSPPEAVISPQAGPADAPAPTPRPALELGAAAAVSSQNVEAPRAEDDALEPQESGGAHVETVTVVRFRMNTLRTRYLRLTVAVAVGAAACAAIVTALLMRRTRPALPHSRPAQIEAIAPRARATSRATPRAPVPFVETPPMAVESLSVEALPTESPPANEALPDEPGADSDTALSRKTTRHVAPRSGSSAKSGVSTSMTTQSGDKQRRDAKPARDDSGLDGAGAKPRAAAATQPEPAGKAGPEPASGSSAKTWKANDPGF